MSIQTLEYRQIIPAKLEACWEFFSSPANLKTITPPSLDFTIVSEVPSEIYEGLMLRYRVRPLFNIPTTWLTEITHVQSPRYFCDEQRVGPYKIWHHEHFFKALPDGKTEVRDLVHYQLPLAPFSNVMISLFVKPRLEEIFNYRQNKLLKIFPN